MIFWVLRGQVLGMWGHLKTKLFIIFILFFPASIVNAACIGSSPNLTVASPYDDSDVQDCVDAASDGDAITVPACDVTWGTAVTWSNKNISIIGAGIGSSVLAVAGHAFDVTATTKGSFRISGFTFNGTTGGTGVVNVYSHTASGSVSGWRLDHLRFNYSTSGGVHPIYITGITYGVIDNCVFDGLGYVSITNYGRNDNDNTYTGDLYWEQTFSLGTSEAVYVEDCEFNFSSSAQSFISDVFHGGSMVFRYNDITYAAFQTHSARNDARGGVKYEIYENTFAGAGFGRPSLIRSGTGVIYRNRVSGYTNNVFVVDNQRTCSDLGTLSRCDGSESWDGNTAGESGWPCLDQIGRKGAFGSQTSEPLYSWSNGPDSDNLDGTIVIALNGDFDLCSSDPPPDLNDHLKTTGDGDPHAGTVLDYVNNGTTPKPGYTAYTYPHPLRGLQKTIAVGTKTLSAGGTNSIGTQ